MKRLLFIMLAATLFVLVLFQGASVANANTWDDPIRIQLPYVGYTWYDYQYPITTMRDANNPCPYYDTNIWYYFEPTQDTLVTVTASSGSWNVMAVVTGQPGAWHFETSCRFGMPNQQTFLARAGTGYYIPVNLWWGYGLDFTLESQIPLTIGVTINPGGSFAAKTGVATVGGQVDCNWPDASIDLQVTVKQVVGRFTVTGQSSVSVSCIWQSDWIVAVTPQNGRFAGGPASVSVTATSIMYQGPPPITANANAEAKVTLRKR